MSSDGELDEATVVALGELSEALETVERARGHLYSFHQLIGHADFTLGDAADDLAKAGHGEWAAEIHRELVGRNVLPGRWTYQVIEEFEDTYYEVFRALERRVRDDLAGGRRHLYEARLKERRRSKGMPGHEAAPG
ncbi:hypothetical protein Acsp03_50380 [Actinomadura sp. NBRC 104412]|uniref:hypothetical protein n=1 Tax=Actinomadura sp. NBRC 104412 TaxID=3032203 RepID=UPI0024A54C45|nr:hypothetical protein [Actinomadura sp. NBRC 104412]GLZ07572.1 hypothetical protein Acsp03_50380 [Actinomadura sp. NBRC 104412]